MCYKEKAEQAQQRPGNKTTINKTTIHPAEDNRKKQCRPNETKLYRDTPLQKTQ